MECLGNRLIIKGRPTGVFNELVEKLAIRLNDWRAKVLSCVDRATFIRIVLQSILIYAISTDLVLINVCNELDALSQKLWWGFKEDKDYLTLRF